MSAQNAVQCPLPTVKIGRLRTSKLCILYTARFGTTLGTVQCLGIVSVEQCSGHAVPYYLIMCQKSPYSQDSDLRDFKRHHIAASVERFVSQWGALSYTSLIVLLLWIQLSLEPERFSEVCACTVCAVYVVLCGRVKFVTNALQCEHFGRNIEPYTTQLAATVL